MEIYDFDENVIYEVDENGKRRRGRPRKIDPRPSYERPAIHSPLYTELVRLSGALRRGAQSPITPALLTEIDELVAVVEGQIERQREWSKESTPDVRKVKDAKGPTARAHEVKVKHGMLLAALIPLRRALGMAKEAGDAEALRDAADAVQEVLDRLELIISLPQEEEPEEEPAKVDQPLLPETLQHRDQMDASLKYLREAYQRGPAREGKPAMGVRIIYGLDGWAERIEIIGRRRANLRREAA